MSQTYIVSHASLSMHFHPFKPLPLPPNISHFLSLLLQLHFSTSLPLLELATMVVLSKPTFKQYTPLKPCKQVKTPSNFLPNIPVVDLSNHDANTQLVNACEEYGFFKVINHGVPFEFMDSIESEAIKFFSLPQSEKDKAAPATPFGYGNRRIGPNGDMGWVEYLLFKCTSENYHITPKEIPGFSCSAVDDYASSVRQMGCGILELMAEGLKLEQTNVFSKLLTDEDSDSAFRLNHYPPCSDLQPVSVGFGEHTDPQIISILRSNNVKGLQIALKDGTWVSVPPDQDSFFIFIGDSMEVMTNGRFKGVRHRVLTNRKISRLSMIYFGAPPTKATIAPLEALMQAGEKSLYKGFTWEDYKAWVYMSRLSDDRLHQFQKY